MRRRTILLTAFALVFVSANSFAEPPVERRNELIKSLHNLEIPAANNLLDDEIAWLKSHIAEKRRAGEYPYYSNVLIQLGDEQEIKRVMENFPYLPDLSKVGQPRIIEYLENVLLRDESAQYTIDVDVVGAAPDSTRAAGEILETLIRSWEVPVAVRHWAEEVHSGMEYRGPKSYESIRAIVRTWWSDNKDAVKARKWSELKPGHRFTVAEEPSLQLVTQESPRVEQTPSTPSTAPAVTPSPVATKDVTDWVLPVCIGGGLFLLMLRVAVGFRKK